MIILIVLLIGAVIAIVVLVNNSKKQSAEIQKYKNELVARSEQMAATEKKLAADYQQTLNAERVRLEDKHASDISELENEYNQKYLEQEESFNKQLEEIKYKIRTSREILYQKSEKELLVDIMMGLDILSNSQENISGKLSENQQDVRSIKDNMFNVGDSILHDLHNGHTETMEKLGVHGDMTIASILADILDLMSKG